jgi:oxygen-independent coproporphyrinogen-3 oxidase
MKTDTAQQGIYIHIPFCRSRCAYCGFVSSVCEHSDKDYVEALVHEIRERVSGTVDSVYFGGGTPSVLTGGLLKKIVKALRECAEFSADCEITTEANPDSFTDGFAAEAGECGVNRISFGMQSLNNDVLAAAGRRHTAEQALAAVERAKSFGFENLSCDLMLGLPCSSEKDVIASVKTLCEQDIKHLSVYALSVEKGTPLYERGYKVDDDAAADVYEKVCSQLKGYGFERYEVSNFSKRGYECKHNKKYWTLAPYVGLGVAAHSYDGTRRSFNTSDIAGYIAGLRDERRETVTASDALEEYVMLGLRTAEGIDSNRASELCGCEWEQLKSRELNELIKLGMLERTRKGFKLSEKAYYVMNDIIVRLV